MRDGSTLIALQGYGKEPFAVLHLLTPECTLDRGFGTDGTAMITLPAGLRRAHAPGGREGLRFHVADASSGGGAFLAGSYEGEAVVGEVTSHGTVDHAFGESGWAVLPSHGSAEGVVQGPSGRIIVNGGEIIYPGSATKASEWVAALSPRGRLDRMFGGHGRVDFPEVSAFGIERIEVEPNGDILVDYGGGRMGCYQTKLSMLSPSGTPVPRFAGRLARFWNALGFSTFVGDVVIQGEGFTLIGTGQRTCLGAPHAAHPRRPGLLARFKPDGEPVGPTIRFPSEMFSGVSAFTEGHDIMLLTSQWEHEHEQSLIAIEPNGSPARRFAIRGRTQISPPTHGTQGGPGELTLSVDHEFASTSGAPELQLIRLRR